MIHRLEERFETDRYRVDTIALPMKSPHPGSGSKKSGLRLVALGDFRRVP
ncbi:MAG: hypothetical protein ACO3JG_11770 [Luteolibacter sp.]